MTANGGFPDPPPGGRVRGLSLRRRVGLCALLALVVPLPALGATSGDGPEASGVATARIAVSASLDACGTAGPAIVCKIDATWSDVPGASRYSATLTRPDGAAIDYGEVADGAGSFWVTYAGNGTYTVTVSAHGAPPDVGGSRLIAKGSSAAGARAAAAGG